MIIKCSNCSNSIYLTWLSPDQYDKAQQSFMGEEGENKYEKGFFGRIKKWIGKEKDFQPTFFDGTTDLECPECKKSSKVTTENTISYQRGDLEKLGIIWTYFCQNCSHNVEPIPCKNDLERQYILNACPRCKNTVSWT